MVQFIVGFFSGALVLCLLCAWPLPRRMIEGGTMND